MIAFSGFITIQIYFTTVILISMMSLVIHTLIIEDLSRHTESDWVNFGHFFYNQNLPPIMLGLKNFITIFLFQHQLIRIFNTKLHQRLIETFRHNYYYNRGWQSNHNGKSKQ